MHLFGAAQAQLGDEDRPFPRRPFRDRATGPMGYPALDWRRRF
jgi:hypothetical protein